MSCCLSTGRSICIHYERLRRFVVENYWLQFNTNAETNRKGKRNYNRWCRNRTKPDWLTMKRLNDTIRIKVFRILLKNFCRLADAFSVLLWIFLWCIFLFSLRKKKRKKLSTRAGKIEKIRKLIVLIFPKRTKNNNKKDLQPQKLLVVSSRQSLSFFFFLFLLCDYFDAATTKHIQLIHTANKLMSAVAGETLFHNFPAMETKSRKKYEYLFDISVVIFHLYQQIPK